MKFLSGYYHYYRYDYNRRQSIIDSGFRFFSNIFDSEIFNVIEFFVVDLQKWWNFWNEKTRLSCQHTHPKSKLTVIYCKWSRIFPGKKSNDDWVGFCCCCCFPRNFTRKIRSHPIKVVRKIIIFFLENNQKILFFVFHYHQIITITLFVIRNWPQQSTINDQQSATTTTKQSRYWKDVDAQPLTPMNDEWENLIFFSFRCKSHYEGNLITMWPVYFVKADKKNIFLLIAEILTTTIIIIEIEVDNNNRFTKQVVNHLDHHHHHRIELNVSYTSSSTRSNLKKRNEKKKISLTSTTFDYNYNLG